MTRLNSLSRHRYHRCIRQGLPERAQQARHLARLLMHSYCGGRSSRPARLFSLGLLNVPLWVRLRRPHLRGATAAFGLSRLATESMSNLGFPGNPARTTPRRSPTSETACHRFPAALFPFLLLLLPNIGVKPKGSAGRIFQGLVVFLISRFFLGV